MPAKPVWYVRIPQILGELQANARPFLDRAAVEVLFGVGRRRAQQIISPCVTERIGQCGLVDRDSLITRLHAIQSGEEGEFETRRRTKVAAEIAKLRQERIEQPAVMVEAPIRVVSQRLANIPEGVMIAPGRITVEFVDTQQALEKLLALAMAIGNDFAEFEEAAAR